MTTANFETYAKNTYLCPECLNRTGNDQHLTIGPTRMDCLKCGFRVEREMEIRPQSAPPYVDVGNGDPLRLLWLICFTVVVVCLIVWSCR